MDTTLEKLKFRSMITGYLFLLPTLIGLIAFIIVPIFMAFGSSLTNWDAFNAPKFIGLDNFKRMMSDETFKIAVINNFIFTLGTVPLSILFGLTLALLLNRSIKGISFFRTVYFFPHITSMLAVSLVWRLLYNPEGPINSTLRALGVADPPLWLSSSKWALLAIMLMASWKSAGYYMLLLLAGLTSIPRQLYESAYIDGANTVQKFFRVTLPTLSPTLFFVTVMAVINSFKVFDSILIMTQGGPGRSTHVLVYTIYQQGFLFFDFGYASAMAIVLFVIILSVTLLQFKAQDKWVTYM